jgi:peptide/nickel transport system ATP-binding protein
MTERGRVETTLAVNGLSISFPRGGSAGPVPRAVDGVSFELRPGRVLALVGESGSGKSATAMSILGLLPPGTQVGGSVRLEGDELLGADAATLRRVRGGRIGTIFQEPMSAFTPAYHVGWQIAEAITAHQPKLSRRVVRERVLALLGSVGLREPERTARSYPHELSGGQLQRAMIAMAISCDPVALIADEPTTALDVTVQAGILELLRSLRDRSDTAILLITHDMGVVADLADEVVVLRQGAIVETGAVQQLFDAPQADYTRELLAAVPRLDRIRVAEPAVAETSAPVGVVTDGVDLAAEVREARIVYGGRGWRGTGVIAVDAASFGIERGRTFGLVGESGSGKSTLGRAFAGLLPLRSGSIRVDGVDLSTMSGSRMRRLRRSIGYVFQDPASSINPRTLVGDAITEPLRLHTSSSATERRARAAELLEAVRLSSTVIDRFPHELSGGQRQRVAIARAIALNPALLIADEPTSALDVSVQARVLELLAELQREFGFACLFISHDLAVVKELADEVAVMRNGRIVESGPADRVLIAPEHPYTRRLLAAAPVADPAQQRTRREQWLALTDDDPEVAA